MTALCRVKHKHRPALKSMVRSIVMMTDGEDGWMISRTRGGKGNCLYCVNRRPV